MVSERGPVRVTLLGTPGLTLHDGADVRLGEKSLALLAYLCLEHDQPHRRSNLADLLWPGMDERRARDNLRLTLFRLRQHLVAADAGWLIADRECIGVDLTPTAGAHMQVDVHDLLDGSLPMDLVSPLADVVPLDCARYRSWWLAWAERTRAAAVTQLHDAAEVSLAAGDGAGAEALASTLLDIDELAEGGHEILARAALARGDVDGARSRVAACTRLLDQHLGVRPSPTLTSVVDVTTADPVVAPADDPDRRGRPLLTRPLPSALTPFTGRQAELGRLVSAISRRDTRLVTIVGPGGTGKTRLAMEVARATDRTFDEGAVLVPLDDVAHARQIPSMIGAALGLPGVATAPDPLDDLCRRLADREVLVVADNVEHLLADGAASTLAALARQCPWMVLLCTSRQPLGVLGEDVHAIHGLCVPTAVDADMDRYDAVVLLLDRLRRIDKSIRLDATTAEPIQQICAIVGGSPLGLELAASAIAVQTLPEIARTLRDAPGTLPSALVGVPPRHADLNAVFAHSLACLDGADRALALRLSIFRGGFTSEHAAAVTDADPTALARLCAAGLLQRSTTGRYRMHELIWQMAQDTEPPSADRDELARRHSDRYLHDLAVSSDALNRAGAEKLVERLDEDRANIAAAWGLAVAHGDEGRLRAASAGLVSWAANAGGGSEAHRMVRAAVSLAHTPDARARWLLREATLANLNSADLSEIEPTVTAGIACVDTLADDHPAKDELRARFDLLWGVQLVELGTRFPESRVVLERARRAADSAGDPTLSAFVELRMGYHALEVGDFDTATDLMARAAEALTSVGHVRGAAVCRKGLAHVLDERFQLWSAHTEITAALRDVQTLGNRVWEAHAHELEASVLTRLGLYEQGVSTARAAIETLRSAGQDTHLRSSLMIIGAGLAALGHREEAARAMTTSVRSLRAAGAANARRYLFFIWARFLVDDKRWAEAELVTAELIELHRSMGNHLLEAAARALHARVLVGAGQHGLAGQHLDAAWPLVQRSVDRLMDPLETLMECAVVASALGNDPDASLAVQLAAGRLREVATTISEPQVRRCFLESGPAVAVRRGDA